MQLITLITDWGNKDFFAGMVKGKLYSLIPDCQVVDITHGIEPYHISDAIIVAKNACFNFPVGSIHLIDVNSFESNEYTHVAIEYRGHFFICTDNGIPYGIFGEEFDKACRITIYQDSNFFSFAALDLFAKVAGILAKEKSLDTIGEPMHHFQRSIMSSPTYNKSSLSATIIYIDNYGNAYLNLTYTRFVEICNGRKFCIPLKSKNEKIERVSLSYADVDRGEQLLTVSATGYLQIAINNASAAKLLGLHLMDLITIDFTGDL